MNDTLAGLLQVLALVAAARRRLRAPRRLHGARLHRREALAGRGARLPPRAGRPRVRPTLDRPTPQACSASPSSRIVLLYLLQRLQPLLPLSFGRGAVPPGMAFNNAVSFTTNTNWQSYVPEQVMGDTVQMAGFTVQNVMSAAVGLAVAVALDPRHPRRPDRAPRQLLGRPHPRRGPHPAAALVRRGDPAGGGWCRDVAEVRLRRDHRGRHAVHDPARARGLPGSDQGARDERRRHLQRQLRAPVREPERAARTSSRSSCCS